MEELDGINIQVQIHFSHPPVCSKLLPLRSDQIPSSELHFGHRTPSGHRIDRIVSILFASSSRESSNFDAIPISSFIKVSDIGFIAKNYSILRPPFLDMSVPD
jgi:hypothetical protein